MELGHRRRTAEEAAATTDALLSRLGCQAVRLEHSGPGILVSRFSQVLFREFIYLIEQGVITAAEANKAVKYAVRMRYTSIRLLEYYDDVGFELESAIAKNGCPDLYPTAEIQTMTANGLRTGSTGLKAGRGLHGWPEKDVTDYQNRKQASFWDVTKDWKLPER